MWYLGLSHSETGADLPLQQWPQPAGLLLLGAVAHEQLHVACVWSRTVKYLKGNGSIMTTPMSILKTSKTQDAGTGDPSPSWKFFLSPEKCRAF